MEAKVMPMDKLEAMRVFCTKWWNGSFALLLSDPAIHLCRIALGGAAGGHLAGCCRTTRRISLTKVVAPILSVPRNCCWSWTKSNPPSRTGGATKGHAEITTSAGLAMRHLAPGDGRLPRHSSRAAVQRVCQRPHRGPGGRGFDLALRVGASSGPSNNVARRIGRTNCSTSPAPIIWRARPLKPLTICTNPCIT